MNPIARATSPSLSPMAVKRGPKGTDDATTTRPPSRRAAPRAKRCVTTSVRCVPTSPSGAASARRIRSRSGWPPSRTSCHRPIRSAKLRLVQERLDLTKELANMGAQVDLACARGSLRLGCRQLQRAPGHLVRCVARCRCPAGRADAGRHQPLAAPDHRHARWRRKAALDSIEVTQRPIRGRTPRRARPHRASPRVVLQQSAEVAHRRPTPSSHCVARSDRRRRVTCRRRPAPRGPAG